MKCIYKKESYLLVILVLFSIFSISTVKAQQFNTDSYLVMPHGTGTFVLTAGERNSSFASSFGLIPRFEFFAQTFLYWENQEIQSPQHFSTSLYAKYSIWVDQNKTGGLSVFLGWGHSPSYYKKDEYLSDHKNYWSALTYTLPLFNNVVSWDFMPGAMVDLEYADSKEAAWAFTYSSRLNIYKIIPKTAIVAEIFGTEGQIYSEPEYKVGLRWEPNDFIIPALTYGNNIAGTGAAGFEIGIMIFTPPFLKKDFIKNNYIQY